jgi:hypothetical protein
MHLTYQQEIHFFTLFDALIDFVYESGGITGHRLDRSAGGDRYDRELTQVLRRLWADLSIIDRFIAANPAGFDSDDLAVISDWKHALKTQFVVARHEGGYSHFLADGKIYAVAGISKDISTMITDTPCIVMATLLPFKGHIIYDTQIVQARIAYSPDMLKLMSEDYEAIRKQKAIYTTALAFIKNAAYHREERHQRELDKKIEDFEKKERADNPDSVMPKGMHKGSLAGLSPAQRADVIREEDEKLENDPDFGIGESFSYTISKFPKGTPKTKLADAYEATTKNRLVELARSVGIPQAYKMKKAELIEVLIDDERVLKGLPASYFTHADDQQFALFKELLAQGGVMRRTLSKLKPDDLLPASSPFITHYRNGDQLTTVMPKEFIEALQTLDSEGLIREREHRKHIKSCIYAFTGLYGVISLGDFRDIYQQYYPHDPLDIRELFAEIVDMRAVGEISCSWWFHFDEDVEVASSINESFESSVFLVFPSLYASDEDFEDFFDSETAIDYADVFDDENEDEGEDAEDYGEEDFEYDNPYEEWRNHLIERHQKIPRKILDKESVEGFFLFSSCLLIPQVQKLQQFLDTFVPDDQDDLYFADQTIIELIEMAQFDVPIKSILEELKKGGLAFENIELMNDFLAILSDALNAIPRWSNNGHSPNELFFKGSGPMPLDAHGQAAAAKVERNDPCPCGSGKKYKRCCGKS